MSAIGILVSLPINITPLVGIQQVIIGCKSLSGKRTLEIYLHLTLLGTLGGNDDDTIGSLSTIDGSRRCILQDLDTLYIIGRQD